MMNTAIEISINGDARGLETVVANNGEETAKWLRLGRAACLSKQLPLFSILELKHINTYKYSNNYYKYKNIIL